jgi:hypothetical protein
MQNVSQNNIIIYKLEFIIEYINVSSIYHDIFGLSLFSVLLKRCPRFVIRQ